MCAEGGDVPGFRCQFKLIVALIEIQFAESFAPILVSDHLFHGRGDMTFTFDGLVHLAHVNAHTYLTWRFCFRRNHVCGNPRRRAFDAL